jgi:hypothetical protein
MDFIKNFESLFPITVYAAIILFIVKELFEFVKKTSGERRRIQAIKEILSEELERNLWAHKVLERTVKDSIELLEEFDNPVFGINITSTGEVRFWQNGGEDSGAESSHSLPEVKQERYESIVLELAQLDKALFNSTRSAYDSIKELAHVRKSLIETLTETSKYNGESEDLWRGFLGYAEDELKDIYKSMNDFYTSIKGKPLTKHRLR